MLPCDASHLMNKVTLVEFTYKLVLMCNFEAAYHRFWPDRGRRKQSGGGEAVRSNKAALSSFNITVISIGWLELFLRQMTPPCRNYSTTGTAWSLCSCHPGRPATGEDWSDEMWKKIPGRLCCNSQCLTLSPWEPADCVLVVVWACCFRVQANGSEQ